jgi:hypothetical protein
LSYTTIHACYNDPALRGRVTACCATQGVADPDGTAFNMMWDIATASDVEAAYASALAADNPNPGGDDTVITDQMILSSVQAHLPTT